GLLNCGSRDELKELYRSQVDYALSAGQITRESKWTDSLAVGSKEFVEDVQAKLGIKAAGRTARERQMLGMSSGNHSSFLTVVILTPKMAF
ncbi:MAG: hypothetical protein AB1611_22015, partial [bacterium]